MKILIDADGCPVVDIAWQLAAKYDLECVLFADYNHDLRNKQARVIVSGQGPDSSDYALLSYSRPNDVVVTQDYGLAALALAKRARVLSQDGKEYTQDNIEGLLEARHLAKKLRRRGQHLRGPGKRTANQDQCFYQALERMILYAHDLSV